MPTPGGSPRWHVQSMRRCGPQRSAPATRLAVRGLWQRSRCLPRDTPVARGFRAQDETKDACDGEQNALVDSLEDEPVAWVLKALATHHSPLNGSPAIASDCVNRWHLTMRREQNCTVPTRWRNNLPFSSGSESSAGAPSQLSSSTRRVSPFDRAWRKSLQKLRAADHVLGNTVRRYGESNGSPAINRRWAMPRLWYGIVGNK